MMPLQTHIPVCCSQRRLRHQCRVRAAAWRRAATGLLLPRRWAGRYSCAADRSRVARAGLREPGSACSNLALPPRLAPLFIALHSPRHLLLRHAARLCAGQPPVLLVRGVPAQQRRHRRLLRLRHAAGPGPGQPRVPAGRRLPAHRRGCGPLRVQVRAADAAHCTAHVRPLPPAPAQRRSVLSTALQCGRMAGWSRNLGRWPVSWTPAVGDGG